MGELAEGLCTETRRKDALVHCVVHNVPQDPQRGSDRYGGDVEESQVGFLQHCLLTIPSFLLLLCAY